MVVQTQSIPAQSIPITFQYSHTIGRQEVRSGNGFFNPVALTSDADGRLYVLSRGTETPAFIPCKRVTVFTPDEEFIRDYGQKIPPEEVATPAQRRSAPNGSFMWPTSVALDRQGRTYVADEWLNRISIFDPEAQPTRTQYPERGLAGGEWTEMWGTPGSADGEIDRPSGLAFDQDDRLYVVDSRNHRVQVFTKDGKFLFNWGGYGAGPGQFDTPWGIDIDRDGAVYVADWRNDRIQKFAADGRFLMQFGGSGDGPGEFNRPTGVAVDREGIIYVADYKNDRLQVFDAEGGFITLLTGEATMSKWGQERIDLDFTIADARRVAQDIHEREKVFQGPIAVETDDAGRVFVLEVVRHRLQVFYKQSPIFQGGLL